jgi:hypothetical protein
MRKCIICDEFKELEFFKKEKGTCDPCGNEKRKKYMREYYLKNKEKAIQNSRKYYQENKEKAIQNSRKYYQENKDDISLKAKKFRIENNEEVKEKQRQYWNENKDYKNKKRRDKRIENNEEIKIKEREYYQKNKDSINERRRNHYIFNKDEILFKMKAYREENKEKYSLWRKQYRKDNKEYHKEKYGTIRRYRDVVRRIRTNISGRSEELLGESFENITKYLENNKYGFMITDKGLHIDHIVPLSTASSEEDLIRLTHYTNLQLLPGEYNIIKGSKKWNKLDFEKWLRESYK